MFLRISVGSAGQEDERMEKIGVAGPDGDL